MFLVDTEAGRIIDDAEVKAEVAAANPWAEWVKDNLIDLKDLPEREHVVHTAASVNIRQRTFGYTTEELRILLGPMARTGAEPLGAMGSDTPVAVLSKRPRLLFDYFVQSFAQVTNPPLDAIREELVTSLTCAIGPNGNLLDTKQVRQPQVSLPFPVINNDQLAKIAEHRDADGDKVAMKVRGLYRPEGGENALRARLTEICEKVSGAINRGVQYIVLSDRDSNAQWAPIPSLLLISAVHHHLLEQRQPHQDRAGGGGRRRPRGPPRRRAHRLRRLRREPVPGHGIRASSSSPPATSWASPPQDGVYNLIKGLGKGVLKIMSKMGISTVASYTRRPDLRSARPGPGARGRVLRRHALPARRRRPRRHRRRSPRPGTRMAYPRERHRTPHRPCSAAASTSGAATANAAPVQPGDRVPAAARHA